MKLQRTTCASAAVLVMVIAASSTASASTPIGQAPPPTGTPVNCSPGVALQGSVGTGTGYVVPPGGGVITSWSTSLTGSVDFSTFRGSGSSWTRLSDVSGEGTGTLTSFPVRIPVSPGDRIGLVMPSGSTPGCAFKTTVPGDSMLVAAAAPIGSPMTFVDSGQFRLNVSAVVEPDADADGFGDETQDFCLGDPSRHAPCEPKPVLVKKPSKKTTKAKASFTFKADKPGDTFACAIDGGTFGPCTSPFKKRFKPGKHSFQLQATDTVGNRSVPISYTWLVQRPRKHH